LFHTCADNEYSSRSYLVGLVFTTSAGEYWLTLFDSFGATGLTFIAFTGPGIPASCLDCSMVLAKLLYNPSHIFKLARIKLWKPLTVVIFSEVIF
jgi:hypothetical protein